MLSLKLIVFLLVLARVYSIQNGTLYSPGLLNINANTNSEFSYEKIQSIAEWLLSKSNKLKPKIALISGTGLGELCNAIENSFIIPYKDIPSFPQTSVATHKGNLIFGTLSNVSVVCMQGKIFSYEGYSNALSALPIKIFKLMGVETLILTGSSGGINKSFKVGDIMLVKDHIAFPLWTLQNPLIGYNDERFGPRFPAANKIYTKAYRDIFKQIAKDLNEDLKEGVYSYYGGPNYETVTELRAMSLLGADSVGMSMAPEALVASYCGIKVASLVVIGNKVILEYDSENFPKFENHLKFITRKVVVVKHLIKEFIMRISNKI